MPSLIFQMTNSVMILVMQRDIFNLRLNFAKWTASSDFMQQRCRRVYREQSRYKNTLYITDCYCKLCKLIPLVADHPVYSVELCGG